MIRFSYSEDNVDLLSTMLHASIRSLNSLADLEALQGFYEKYFGNTVENRNPKLMEVLRFEEEVLRQKIEWREKYESVISGWMSSKATKSKLVTYHAKTESAADGGGGGDEGTNTIDGQKVENADALNETEKSQPTPGGTGESTPAPDGGEQSEPASSEAKNNDTAPPNEAKGSPQTPSGDGGNKSAENTVTPSVAEQRDTVAASTTTG